MWKREGEGEEEGSEGARERGKRKRERGERGGGESARERMREKWEGEGEEEDCHLSPPPPPSPLRAERSSHNILSAPPALSRPPPCASLLAAGGTDPDELHDVVDVVDTVAGVEGRGPDKIEGNHDGGDGEYPPRHGPEVVPRAVLAQPEEDVDVFVIAPGGEEEGGPRHEHTRVVICGGGDLGRAGDEAEGPHNEVIEEEPSEGYAHDVSRLNGMRFV
jgi:hypothetical protein